ncbi:DNA/RNA helicase domain-containing protein [Kitasatospora sp. NPDC001159]
MRTARPCTCSRTGSAAAAWRLRRDTVDRFLVGGHRPSQDALERLAVNTLLDRVGVLVLFLDERQIVRPTEGSTLDELTHHAHESEAVFRHIDLETQFRCNGSQGYDQWVVHVCQLSWLVATDSPYAGLPRHHCATGSPARRPPSAGR